MFALRRIASQTLVSSSRRAFAVNTIEDINDVNNLINETKAKNSLLVIDWYATWCGPCRSFSPVFTRLSEQYPQAKFVKVC